VLYSKVFGKTNKASLREAQFVSHQLLYRAGFIRKSKTGYYYFLPLGWRVHRRIEAVIRQEMNVAGAQEMLAPTLHPIELWQETNRINAVNFELMTTSDRSGAKFALGGTAEEMFVDLVRRMHLSYHDLPFNIYQFSTKFRDELRPRGGLLRTREFIMKDAYSFDDSQKASREEYENMKKTYRKIFNRLGLSTLVVEADSGYIGGDYCHEFIFLSSVGEDTIFTCSHCSYQASEEKAIFQRQFKNPKEKEKPFRISGQPEWVCTMADNVKHYGEPLWRYLKNVVYKDNRGRIIIASTRGDQTVNEAKLKNLLGVDFLEPAGEKDLIKIGTRSGWVNSWGHRGVVYVGDLGLKMVKNFIGGQKEEKTDAVNVNYGRDFKYKILGDIVNAENDNICQQCGQGKLQKKKGIELGHIFQLGRHYTDLMKGADFVDSNGEAKAYYMGCYGIGLGRTMAAIVENSHDDQGIIWPKAVTPYWVHLIGMKGAYASAKKFYQQLRAEKISVLYDDRLTVSAGEKFADADLIGIPIRLVVSPKTGNKIEWKERIKKKVILLRYNEVIEKLEEYYKEK